MNNIDELTKLFNRREMYKVAEVFLKQQDAMNVIYIDINEFVWINDNYGHLEGDSVLIKLGNILKGCTNQSDKFAFRVAGDEFIILCPTLELQKVDELAKNIFKDFQALKIFYTKNDKKSYSLNLNIDVLSLQKKYFDENDFSFRQYVYEVINNAKLKQNYKSGVFNIDIGNKIICKIF